MNSDKIARLCEAVTAMSGDAMLPLRFFFSLVRKKRKQEKDKHDMINNRENICLPLKLGWYEL